MVATKSTGPVVWWHEPFAGALGGILDSVFLHPMDTLRTKLDTATTSESRNPVRALLDTAKRTYATNGIRGFYGGYVPTILLNGPCTGVYLGGFHAFRRFLDARDATFGDAAPWKDAASGLVAQCCAGVLFTPLDVLKQRLQVAVPGTTFSHVVGALYATRGVRGLWRGYTSGVLTWGPYSAVYFSVYEMLKLRWVQHRRDGDGFDPRELAAGMVAGAFAGMVTQPMDCLKTRLQVREQTAIEVFRQASRDPAALMRGGVARSLWLAPGAGITLAVFEWVNRSFSAPHPTAAW
eukprot:m.59642 g.59642  ORF g.59642 m.59642 type:complete len:293 (+) comp15708_c0_seq3:390-1268(+)